MVIGMSGCKTIKGLGKDLQNAGEALEKNLKIISNEI
jgi:predicted small secreted protein